MSDKLSNKHSESIKWLGSQRENKRASGETFVKEANTPFHPFSNGWQWRSAWFLISDTHFVDLPECFFRFFLLWNKKTTCFVCARARFVHVKDHLTISWAKLQTKCVSVQNVLVIKIQRCLGSFMGTFWNQDTFTREFFNRKPCQDNRRIRHFSFAWFGTGQCVCVCVSTLPPHNTQSAKKKHR